MTLEEVLEKYGDLELTFSSFYKYAFTYHASVDDVQITCYFGGVPEDIYRAALGPQYPLKDFLRLYPSTQMTIQLGPDVVFHHSPEE